MSYHAANKYLKPRCGRPSDDMEYFGYSKDNKEAFYSNKEQIPTSYKENGPCFIGGYNIEDNIDRCMIPRLNKLWLNNPPRKYSSQDLENMQKGSDVHLNEEYRARHEVLHPDDPWNIHEVPEFHKNYIRPVSEKFPESLEDELTIYGRVDANRPSYDFCNSTQEVPSEKLNYNCAYSENFLPECIREMEKRDKPHEGFCDHCDNTAFQIVSSRKLCDVKKNLFNPVLPTLRRKEMDDVIQKLPEEHCAHSTFAQDYMLKRREPFIECDVAAKQLFTTCDWKDVRKTKTLKDLMISTLELNNPLRRHCKNLNYKPTPNYYLDPDIDNPKYDYGHQVPRLGRWPQNLVNLPPARVPDKSLEDITNFKIRACKCSPQIAFESACLPSWW